MKVIEGALAGKGLRFGIVVSRFNEFFASHLLEGAMDCLSRHQVAEKDITVARVPGAFELPMVARKMAKGNSYDAVIALGAVIRGSTPHFDYIAAEVAKGLAVTGLDTGKPVIFGVITCDTLEQAMERSGTKAGNKGFDAALSAIEMANLYKTL